MADTLDWGQALGISSHFVWQILERYLATELRIVGSVHLAHFSRTHRGENLVLSQCHAWLLCH